MAGLSKGLKWLRSCPACGKKEGVRIIYGAPPREVYFLHEQGEVILGECRKKPTSPDWHCRDCGCQWKDG